MLRDVAATMWARIHNPPATKEDEVADAILGTATLVPDDPAVVSFISNSIVQYISENPPQATWDYMQGLTQRVHEYMLTQPQWPQMLPLSTLAYREAEPIPEPEPPPPFSLLKEQVARVLSSLSPEEGKVLELRFGLKDGRSRSLEDVAGELGYSNEDQVREVEARALRKIGHREILKT